MFLREIKDRTPNQSTIDMLETMLANAKSGELRTIVVVSGWDDDAWTHSWSIDARGSSRRLIGELTMLHFDMVTNQAFRDGDTVLNRAFED